MEQKEEQKLSPTPTIIKPLFIYTWGLGAEG